MKHLTTFAASVSRETLLVCRHIVSTLLGADRVRTASLARPILDDEVSLSLGRFCSDRFVGWF